VVCQIFLAVALALHELGYKPIGIRLDSGDLAYLSKQTREQFRHASTLFNIPYFEHLKIVASSDISEKILHSLNAQKHEIDVFGVGTNLVTCEDQPALGCVYKLVEIAGIPRMKLSNNNSKVSIPCRKEVYRLYGKDGKPILDLITKSNSPSPEKGKFIECRHPFDEIKRVRVTPNKVEALFSLVWNGKSFPDGKVYSINEIRQYREQQISALREDVVRYLNPTPYKVSVDKNLYEIFHELWLHEAPIQEIQ